QETDRRSGVDGQDLDHPGLPGLQIDRAVNVDALTPARLSDRELLLFWRPAADRLSSSRRASTARQVASSAPSQPQARLAWLPADESACTRTTVSSDSCSRSRTKCPLY